MTELVATLEEFLDKPRTFTARYGAMQREILDALYAEDTRGRAAALQSARVLRLAGTTTP
ncbi:hypothetical protein BST95_19380 (plasmid) [Halioglobus japonicus]|nr:hypothetical protein [Halioglobus japonicus]AQA20408.1 hypothetical protein BST95_19380 [Halioglobus japonicus]